ncbi:MAG TPA: DUF6062 family protein [Candidatus Limnocylindrales bacterium]|nr:DUF6062 family protein [Candidatus Limnocylindrales bacterium]
MTPLRVRSGADIHLADAFAAPGCPLCRERARTEANYLESILAESVLDVGYRADLDAARGYCRLHARAFLDADRRRSGSLGASILLRASLVPRLRDLEAAASARGWSRSRRVAEARRPPACPACERVATADARSVETVVRQSEQDDWAEAASQAPFCLDHLLALMDVRSAPTAWAAVEAAQVARLGELRDRLERFAHASSQDRRHLQTEDQRAAVAEAADLLAGPRAGEPPGVAVPGGAGRAVDPSAVLLTGVYGTGKTTLAAALADRLVDVRVPVAAIDVDWLGWYEAPAGFDEHEDPRMSLDNLGRMVARYRDVGVERFVLAWTMPDGVRPRLEAVLGMPLTVVRLDADAATIRRRLEGDALASRAHDLARALERLEAGDLPAADWALPADASPDSLAGTVLARLGWLPPD